MTQAIRLGAPADDAARLHCLLTAWPGAWEAPWGRISTADGHWLVAEGLEAHAAALEGQGITLDAAPDGARIEAASLAAALPLRSAPEIAPAEALFVIPMAEAHPTLTRLLRLDRADVAIADWASGDERLLAIRVPDPPLYLLMRARDEAEGVRAYARSADTLLFTAWGWAHPLAARIGPQLTEPVLIAADGRWSHARWPTDWRPLAARIDAALEAPRIDLAPADGAAPRFVVHLRLEEARPTVGTLWLLDAEAFGALAPVIETSSPDALERISVTRLAEPVGVRYLLRSRASDDAVSGRIGDLIGDPGFAHVPGAERIFVPAGLRLAPPMRLDALRAVIDPPADGLAVVEATRDGPRVLRIGASSAVPLKRWVDYVVLDNRQVLDEILEESIFALPQIVIDRPTATVQRQVPPPPKPRRPQRERARARPASDALTEVAEEGVDPALRAQQIEAAALQAQIVAGGCTDPAILGRMGELLIALGAASDAGWCFEAAAFHGGSRERQRWLTPLLALRRRQLTITAKDEDAALLDAATSEAPSPAAIGLLGVDSCVRSMQGTPLIDGLRPALLKIFADPIAPATRRLAWLTLYELAAATDDRLGATRAKEALLGGLNTTGLRDLFDAPGFVRLALALAEDDQGAASDARSIQSASLEAVWSTFTPGHEDVDVQALLYKAVFAVGFARVGAGLTARRLAEAVTEELPVHDPPSAALARLYLARLATLGSEDGAEAFEVAAGQAVAGLWDSGHRRAVSFSRSKSLWLAAERPPPEVTLRSVVARPLEQLVEPERAPAVLQEIGRLRGIYDLEVAAAIERVMSAALRTGRDPIIAETLAVALPITETIHIPVHQVRAIGHLLRGQAIIDDEQGIERSLHGMARLIREIDHFGAIRPTVEAALAALRRVDGGPHALRLFDELAAAAERGEREAARLGGFVADGYRLLGKTERAQGALTLTLDAIFAPNVEHVTRFDAASSLLDLLRAWPSEIREQVARQLLARIERFRDGFTTRRFFELLKVMCVERIVDTLADTESHGSGRIRGWLEREEQAIRRRILTDWRQI